MAEKELAALARKYRVAAKKSRAAAGRDLGVTRVSIFQAEEMPEKGFTVLRKRMIEAYSDFKVIGPVFYLEKK